MPKLSNQTSIEPQNLVNSTKDEDCEAKHEDDEANNNLKIISVAPMPFEENKNIQNQGSSVKSMTENLTKTSEIDLNATNELNAKNEVAKHDSSSAKRLPCKEWRAKNVSIYDFGSMIGKGTFGKVFKAKLKSEGQSDDSSESYVALKKLNMSKEEEGFPITALREIQILKRVKHPNVVSLLDIVIDKRKQWPAHLCNIT